MANSDKNITITPNSGQADQPKIEFTGADNNTVTLSTLDSGALSVEGSSGQLFSVKDSLSTDLFTVSDISGIPIINTQNDGTLELNPYNSNVLVGTILDDDINKLQVSGGLSVTGTSGQLFNVVDETSGDLLKVNDVSGGPAFTVTEQGGVRTPTNPLFFCEIASGISTPQEPLSGSDWLSTAGAFVDTQNAFDVSSGAYYVPISGYYYIDAKVTLYSQDSSADSRFCAVRIYKNGVQYGAGHNQHRYLTGSSYSERSINHIMYLEKNDYIQIWINSAVNGQQTTTDSHLLIRMVG
jgi:hypothetical protein